jgi:hypothetical protein
MQISCLEDQDLVTIAVAGELEVYSLPEFSRLAESYLGGPAKLILDMVNLQPHVARVFRITRLDQILDVSAVTQPAL